MKKFILNLFLVFVLFLVLSLFTLATAHSQIAFTISEDLDAHKPARLCLIDNKGNNYKELLACGRGSPLVWSSDGSMLLVLQKRQDTSWQVIIDLNGHVINRLPTIFRPSWSKNGKSVTFAVISSVCEFDIESSETKEILSIENSFICNPVWSPDGKKLAFYYLSDQDKMTEFTVAILTVNPAQLPYRLKDLCREKGVKKNQEIYVPKELAIIAKVNILELITDETVNLQWTPSGQYLIFCTPGGLITPFDGEEDKKILQSLDKSTIFLFDSYKEKLSKLAVGEGPIRDVKVSHSGKMVAFSTIDKIKTLEIPTLQELSVLDAIPYSPPITYGFFGPIGRLSWSTNDQSIVFHTSAQIFILDLKSQKLKQIYQSPEEWINSVSWSPK